MRYIILLLIIVPALELGLMILSGKTIGVLPTVLLIIITGILGAYLAKKQGLEVIRKAQGQFNYGQMPGEALLDGICIFIGAVFLITPGFVTDVLGIFLLVPFTRKFSKLLMMKWLKNRMDKGRIKIIR